MYIYIERDVMYICALGCRKIHFNILTCRDLMVNKEKSDIYKQIRHCSRALRVCPHGRQITLIFVFIPTSPLHCGELECDR